MRLSEIKSAGVCAFPALQVVIPASLVAIEPLLEKVRGCSECYLQGRELFAVELLLREALTNAVVHGSQNDPARSIRCTLRVKAGWLIVNVADEGEGFDWRRQRSRQAESSACSGRGMEIFRKYASRVRFNEKGNAVTLAKSLEIRNQSNPGGVSPGGVS